MSAVDRAQVLAYRIAAQGLHRETSDPVDLAVFDLGVQDSTRRTTAGLALAARSARDGECAVLTGDERFTLAWSVRGAPHFHRAGGFGGLIRALLPLDDADARARLSWRRADVTAADMGPRAAVTTAARALRDVVTTTMTKGEASEAVTRVVPGGLTRWCRICGATHIHEQLMRLATPPAGVRLEPGVTPATLTPLRPRPPLPDRTDVTAATRLVRDYLRLHGPATPDEAAGYLGTTRATVATRLWPEDLAEVRVDGRVGHIPAEALPILENPPEPDPVRLLPPGDPFLQARDRTLLVPDETHRKAVWRVLGNPGALLADGDLVGTWRTTTSGKRLDMTLTGFGPVPARVRAAAEDEADRVRAVRGFTALRVRWS
ncbi:DNA glycosylase AlkZ-like family protein [Saccharomonospora iraqiensis]|uniref:DNA glycosylase AlkZ-like family protein n=1 Tax=Saccharomonospora iraqiensis TaxID=52698 RepID=UPI00022E127C|nr:crosslink repair DNA glycosylase YcaQ family protein [Saccharomonospora iraqiensis]